MEEKVPSGDVRCIFVMHIHFKICVMPEEVLSSCPWALICTGSWWFGDGNGSTENKISVSLVSSGMP